MKQKRRKYTKEFKEEAVKMVTEQGFRLLKHREILVLTNRYLDGGSKSS